MCLTNWLDYYVQNGYLHSEPGLELSGLASPLAKRSRRLRLAKTMRAPRTAMGFTCVDTAALNQLCHRFDRSRACRSERPGGLSIRCDGRGGDWGEGWQYGPLSVAEYAEAAAALESAGASLPQMDAWTNSLIVRQIYATVPTQDGQWVGGDFDGSSPYQSIGLNQVDAVLGGPSSDQAAAWAEWIKENENLGIGSIYIENALAEARTVTAAPYPTTDAPLWYFARGTRALYARTSWDASAFWAVFKSSPHVNTDHEKMDASNLVFSRGADHFDSRPGRIRSLRDLGDKRGDSGIQLSSPATMRRIQTPWSALPTCCGREHPTAAFLAARSDLRRCLRFQRYT